MTISYFASCPRCGARRDFSEKPTMAPLCPRCSSVEMIVRRTGSEPKPPRKEYSEVPLS